MAAKSVVVRIVLVVFLFTHALAAYGISPANEPPVREGTVQRVYPERGEVLISGILYQVSPERLRALAPFLTSGTRVAFRASGGPAGSSDRRVDTIWLLPK